MGDFLGRQDVVSDRLAKGFFFLTYLLLPSPAFPAGFNRTARPGLICKFGIQRIYLPTLNE